MGAPWGPHGATMGPHGAPWGLMGAPWGPITPSGGWVDGAPLGPHRAPWGPMGAASTPPPGGGGLMGAPSGPMEQHGAQLEHIAPQLGPHWAPWHWAPWGSHGAPWGWVDLPEINPSTHLKDKTVYNIINNIISYYIILNIILVARGNYQAVSF